MAAKYCFDVFELGRKVKTIQQKVNNPRMQQEHKDNTCKRNHSIWAQGFGFYALAVLLCGWGTPVMAKSIQDASEGALGLLKIRIEVRGEDTKRASNNVEWESLAVQRIYDVEFPVVLQTISAFDPLQSLSQSAEYAEDEGDTETRYADIASAMASCNGNSACLIETGKKFAATISDDQWQISKVGAGQGEFATWSLPYGSTISCKGKSVIADKGRGVAIDPPRASYDYTYTLSGERVPASEDDCVVILSYNISNNSYSFRLPNLGSIDVIAMVSSSGEQLRRVYFIENLESVSQTNGGILLTNIRATASGKILEGRRQLKGGVSYLFSQDVVPVTATVGWRFEVK